MDRSSPITTVIKNRFMGLATLLACALLTVSSLSLAEYRPELRPFEDSVGTMAAYPKTYEASRERFRRWISDQKASNPKATEYVFKVPSQADKDLTVDVFYVPAERETKNLILFVIGVHGGESYTASAQVNTFLSGKWRDLEKAGTGLLIVHAMNPYGFKYFRRTTEDNIDLNRNFVVDPKMFQEPNVGYERLQHVLVQNEPVSVYSWKNMMLLPRLTFEMVLTSKMMLRDALVSGQRKAPQGVFFGGTTVAPQVGFVKDLMLEKGKEYKKIFFVDFHTGFGQRGVLHLLGADGLLPKHRDFTKHVYENLKLEVPVQHDVYTTRGDSVSWFSALFPEKEVAALCFEMGTVDNQGVLASFISLQALRFESQGSVYGYDTRDDYETARRMSIENFLPEDRQWRSESIKRSSEVLEQALEKFLHDQKN